MAPLTHLDETERAAAADNRPPPASQAPRVLTEADRQGLAMGWVAITLGMLLVLGGLALWAALVFSAGFGAWLLAVGVLGVLGMVMVAVVITANYSALRSGR